MPLRDQEKLQAFSEKVLGEANSAASAMAAEANEQKKEAIAAGKAKISAHIKAKYALRLKKALDDNSFALSTATLEKNKEYLALRDELTEQVLAQTKRRVIEFAQSDAYADYLKTLCQKVGARMQEPFTLCLAPQDEPYEALAAAAAGPLCKEVRKSEDILIGGAKFYAQTGGVVVNETLDENLNHCREELMVLMGKYLRVDE